MPRRPTYLRQDDFSTRTTRRKRRKEHVVPEVSRVSSHSTSLRTENSTSPRPSFAFATHIPTHDISIQEYPGELGTAPLQVDNGVGLVGVARNNLETAPAGPEEDYVGEEGLSFPTSDAPRTYSALGGRVDNGNLGSITNIYGPEDNQLELLPHGWGMWEDDTEEPCAQDVVSRETLAETDVQNGPEEGGNSRRGRPKATFMFDHWQKLLPIFLVNGTIRHTRQQYNELVFLCNYFNGKRHSSWEKGHSITGENDGKPLAPDLDGHPSSLVRRISKEKEGLVSADSVFPSYRTMQRGYRSLLLNRLVPRSSDVRLVLDPRKCGVAPRLFRTCASSGSTGTTTVRLIPISEYARMDVSCPPVYREMVSTSWETLVKRFPQIQDGLDTVQDPRVLAECMSCIDIWPLVMDREKYYGRHIFIHNEELHSAQDTSRFAHIGDSVQIKLSPGYKMVQPFRELFRTNFLNGNVQDILQGDVVASWCAVRSRICDMDSIPESGLTEDERVTIDNFRVDREGNSFSSRLCKPGDKYTMLRPGGNSSDTARVVIVHRFLALQEDSSYFVVGLLHRNAGDDFPGTSRAGSSSTALVATPLASHNESGSSLDVPVSSAKIVQFCTFSRTRPVSSTGWLPDGTRYIIYRFLLFWDGFQVWKGKKASATGVYMVCLNLPIHKRSGLPAVRVLCVAPPGSLVQDLFSKIQGDLSEGMRDGYMDFNGDGERVCIVPDMVASTGDTLGLNEVLDSMSHSADAGCHLCKGQRGLAVKLSRPKERNKKDGEKEEQEQEYLGSSRYTGTDITSANLWARRDLNVHSSMELVPLTDKQRKELGFKAEDNCPTLGMHHLSAALFAVRDQVPKSEDQVRLIPATLDPYRSLLIGPDHLLTGLGRDCINAVLRLITPADRLVFEMYAVTSLRDIGVMTQTRLVHTSSGTLFTMSLSDLYRLIYVSHYAFSNVPNLKRASGGEDRGALQGSSSQGHAGDSGPRSNYCQKVISAVEMLGYYSQLVSKLLHVPNIHVEGGAVMQQFWHNRDGRRVRDIQENITAHLNRVKDICTVPERIMVELQNIGGRRDSIAKAQRRILWGEVQKCNTARVQLDHPNLHRLLELGYTLLPMVQHISRVSELVFEKAHQGLKRGISGAAPAAVYHEAMTAIAVNDWQGRFTMLCKEMETASGPYREKCILALFRLLRGREEVISRRGVLSADDKNFVLDAVGPKGTVDVILKAQNRSVMVEKDCPISRQVQWKLTGRYDKNEIKTCSFLNRAGVRLCDLPGYVCEEDAPEENAPEENACEDEPKVLPHTPVGTVFKVYRDRAKTILNRLYGCGSWTFAASVEPIYGGSASSGIHTGDVLQAFTETDFSHLTVSAMDTEFQCVLNADCSSSTGRVTFWFVISFFSALSKMGAIVLPLRKSEDGVVSGQGRQPFTYSEYKYEVLHNTKGSPCIVYLNSSCRRVGVLHVCTDRCNRQGNDLFVTHSAHTLSPGTQLYLLDRGKGYPPRSV